MAKNVELLDNGNEILYPRTVTEQVAVTANQNLKEKLNEMDANIESVTNEVKDARTNGNTNITYNNLKARLDDEHKKLNNEIEKTNTQLSEIENDLISKIKYVAENDRKFTPKFCYSCYWGEATDDNGGSSTSNEDTMRKDVQSCKDAHVDGFVVIIHISYNQAQNNFYIVEDLDKIKFGVDLMIQNGIKPKAIKLHSQRYTEDKINLYGEERWKTAWKSFITEIGTKFKDSGFEYLTVHNEVQYVYNTDKYVGFVLECFNIARGLGYKTGVTHAGFEEACFNVKSEIRDGADAIFVNHYQSITNEGAKIHKERSVDAWKGSFSLNYIDHLIKYNKPIIISESGVEDYWCALTAPEKYGWEKFNQAPTNGESQYVYLYGAFEVLDTSGINELWSWYSINYPIVTRLISKYVGGVING